MRPPTSLMAAIDPAEVERLAKDSSLWSTYAPESTASRPASCSTAKAAAGAAADDVGPERAQARAGPRARPRRRTTASCSTTSSAARAARWPTPSSRGVLGLLKKRR